MFLADTVDFIIIVFGFWAFGVGSVKSYATDTFNSLLITIISVFYSRMFLSETLGGRHHLVSVRGSSARTLSGHGVDSVWDDGCGPGSVPEKVRHGQSHLSSHPGVWDPFLDVLHSAWSHREVRSLVFHHASVLTWGLGTFD